MARVFTKKKSSGTAKLFVFIVVVILVLIGIWRFAGSLNDSRTEQEMKIAKDAIVRATVQCYSLEGRYPQGLNYLVENYGLTLNEKKYIYYYQAIGENLMPEIRLLPIDGVQED